MRRIIAVAMLLLGCGEGQNIDVTSSQQQVCESRVLVLETAPADQCARLDAYIPEKTQEPPQFRLVGDLGCGATCLVLQPGESAEVMVSGPVQYTTWPAACDDIPPCP